MKNRQKVMKVWRCWGVVALLLFSAAGCADRETPPSIEDVFFEDNAGTQAEASEKPAETESETKPAGPENMTLSTVSAMDVMCAPNGIAVTAEGTILVTDTYNKRLWQVREGSSEIYAGGETAEGLYGEPVGGYHDAELLASSFKQPWAVVEFLDGWAVSDTGNNVVRIVRNQDVQTLNGKTEETLAVSAMGVVFDRPTGLASDSEGNLYVSDTGNGAVRKVSPAGEIVTVAKGLDEPMGLCWKDGVLYIAEAGGNRIVKVEGGKVSTVAGDGDGTEGFEDGSAEQALFASPQGVAVGEDGSVYVADTLNSALRRIRGGQVDTVVIRDTSLADFGLVSPTGLLMQGDRLYICDNFARKLFVLEWD